MGSTLPERHHWLEGSGREMGRSLFRALCVNACVGAHDFGGFSDIRKGDGGLLFLEAVFDHLVGLQ